MNKAAVFVLFLLPTLIFAACGEKTRVVTVSADGNPWLGVGVSDLSKKMLGNLDLKNGIRVTKVYAESPAEKAGLEKDDILISFDGEKIVNSEDLIEFVQKTDVDKKVIIEYVRNGQREKTEVTIAERDKPMWSFKRPSRLMRIHEEGKTWLGVRTENMPEQLRTYFGAPEGVGILIQEVIEESPAEEAGLRAGDVIIRVDRKEINDSADLVRAINYFDPDDEVEFEIIRDKTRKELKIKLGEKQGQFKFHRYGTHPDMRLYIPSVPGFEVEIPEIEILPEDIDINPEEIEIIEEKMGTEIRVKLEKLDDNLKNLNEKLRKISIRVNNVTI